MALRGSFLAVGLLLFVQHITCSPAVPSYGSGNERLRTVYQFPSNTWVENIAVRSNGNLLVTLITSPEVWEINPEKGTGHLVHHFPNVTSGFGITEFKPDVFAVAFGNFSVTTSTPGTYSTWKIDYTTSHPRTKTPPLVTKIADIPEAQNLNGVTTLPNHADTILLSDSFAGLIYRLDTQTGKHTIWADDPLFKSNASAIAALGINGLQHRGANNIYFGNSFSVPVLGRIAITPSGDAILPATAIVPKPIYPTFEGAQIDDFTFDKEGNVWLTCDPSDTLVKISKDGRRRQTVIVGGVGESVVAGDTAAKFGRGRNDKRILYVTTNGGLANPPKSGVVGGRIVAVDTRGL